MIHINRTSYIFAIFFVFPNLSTLCDYITPESRKEKEMSRQLFINIFISWIIFIHNYFKIVFNNLVSYLCTFFL